MEKRSKVSDWVKDSSGLLEKRWYAYALAGAGALAVAPGAHAAIVSSGPSTVGFPSPNVSTASCVNSDCFGSIINISLDNVGNGVFSLQAENSSSTGTIHFLHGGGANPAGVYYNGTTQATPQFAFGSAIGPATGVFNYNNTNHLLNPASAWQNGDTYIGLEFNLPGTGNVFGWAELNFTGGTSSNFVVTLEAYAYEDTGASIDAGDTGLSPEPGTAGMMLLALGACGVAAWRKRKQAQRAA